MSLAENVNESGSRLRHVAHAIRTRQVFAMIVSFTSWQKLDATSGLSGALRLGKRESNEVKLSTKPTADPFGVERETSGRFRVEVGEGF